MTYDELLEIASSWTIGLDVGNTWGFCANLTALKYFQLMYNHQTSKEKTIGHIYVY